MTPAVRHPILFMACAALVAGCATQQAAAPDVPAALKPAADERYAFTWHAAGSQIYECRPGDAGKLAWAFVAPEAELFDDRHERVGVHGAGPHWAASDGSRVTGTVKARSDAAKPGDIPWLLLAAASAGGPGKLAAMRSVQRINTVGGTAPAQGCSVQGDTGKRFKAPYTADYVFFSAK
jgi:hypothetical protein